MAGRCLSIDLPANIFREGKQNAMPVITSANLGELTGPGMIMLPFLVPDYVNILNGVIKAGQKGYACIFDQVPGKWRRDGCVSFHALEMGYVFGDWDNSSRWLSTAFFLAKESGAKGADPGLGTVDKKSIAKHDGDVGAVCASGKFECEGPG